MFKESHLLRYVDVKIIDMVNDIISLTFRPTNFRAIYVLHNLVDKVVNKHNGATLLFLKLARD